MFAGCKDRGALESKKPIDYSPEEVQKASKQANTFFDNAFEEELDFYPEWQTQLGIKKNYGSWYDNSEEQAKKEQAYFKKKLANLEDSIKLQALDSPTRLSYQLYKKKIENSIASHKFRHYNYPVNQMFGTHSKVPSFLSNNHSISNYEEAEAYLSRLEGITTHFAQLVDGLKTREANNVIPPKFVFAKVIDDSKNIIQGAPITTGSKKNILFADFEKKINKLDKLSADQKKTLLKGCEKRLLDNVKPAYENLISFLQQQEKRASTDDGVWKFNNGADYYKHRLNQITTTDLSSEEIHKIGLEEIDRIHGEMKVIMKKVGFKGSLPDFFKFMRDDKQFYYANNEKGKKAYMKQAESIIDEMRPKLDDLFLTKPKAKLIVKQVEPYREKSAGKAFYNSPAPDGSRPGIYYANTYDMADMPKYQMEALAYHEAIPGHHMQLSIAQELKEVPKFRKYGGYTAYVEGWGLYSEYIPKELGLYSDPYSDFGRLSMELWRACRLVVDTGIHTKKWTREKGIQFYKENTPNSEGDCIKMVERHIVMPGQATAYKIGMIKILELREKAKNKLGDKFDIRKFHDVILTNGALPLDVLEDLVDEYIES